MHVCVYVCVCDEGGGTQSDYTRELVNNMHIYAPVYDYIYCILICSCV